MIERKIILTWILSFHESNAITQIINVVWEVYFLSEINNIPAKVIGPGGSGHQQLGNHLQSPDSELFRLGAVFHIKNKKNILIKCHSK